MLVSAALTFLAASAASPQASVPAPSAPAAEAPKPRRICRSEAVIGSITPKRVCTTVPQAAPASTAESNAPASQPQQAPQPAQSSQN